jgi:hypothetical protein
MSCGGNELRRGEIEQQRGRIMNISDKQNIVITSLVTTPVQNIIQVLLHTPNPGN